MSKMHWLVMGVVCTGLSIVPAVMAEEGENKEATDRFAKQDANGDGSISMEEYKVAHERRLERMKEKMGDKYDPETAPKMEETFKYFDTDQSGSISKAEMTAGRDALAPR